MNSNRHKQEQLIELSEIIDERGHLSWIEIQRHIPFDIGSVYWMSDVSETKKFNSFLSAEAIFVVLEGSIDIISNGGSKFNYILDKPYKALHVPDISNCLLKSLSNNTILLIITSIFKDNQKLIQSSIKINEVCQDKSFEPQKIISDCLLVKFPCETKGNLNFVTVGDYHNLPFKIKRIYYIYNIPKKTVRGMHAHKHCHQILVALNGSFDVEIDDGVNKHKVTLDDPGIGLYIPSGVWAVEKEYSSDVICLALASDEYDVNDYINTYTDFLKYRRDANRSV